MTSKLLSGRAHWATLAEDTAASAIGPTADQARQRVPGIAISRRPFLFAAGGAALAALAACSKEVSAPSAAPAATAATPGGDARQAYEAASKGTGFTVGQPMAARSVLVFFDPQCPHCATLWVAAKPLHDRIRMVWMPVAFIRPISGPQGALLLAAPDPKALMDRHESLLAGGAGGLEVSGPGDAALIEKIKANTALWSKLGGGSVPHMIYRAGADGPYGSQPGGLPTAQLETMLGL